MAMLDEEWLKRLREVMLDNQQLRQKLVVMETKNSQVDTDSVEVTNNSSSGY